MNSKLAGWLAGIGALAVATDKVNAGPMHTAGFWRPNEVNELADNLAVSFKFTDGAFVDIGNADDASDEPIDFVFVERGDTRYAIDKVIDFGSDVPTEITPNSEFADGIWHEISLVRGKLHEGGFIRLGFDVDPLIGDPNGPADTRNLFGDATVLVGKGGEFSDTPTTINETIAMYNGRIWRAVAPQGVGLDEELLMTELPSAIGIPGDFDDDGDVDADDYHVWRSGYGNEFDGGDFLDWQRNLGRADGNGNGVVDAADYTVWMDNLGRTPAPNAPLANGGIPEPRSATLLLAGVGVAGWTTRRGMRQLLKR